jgi:hypothetical protein
LKCFIQSQNTGQVIGNILAAVFGTLTPGALNISPIGAVIGFVLQAVFGAGWTPSSGGLLG